MPTTVKSYLQSAMHKLGTRNRVETVRAALRMAPVAAMSPQRYGSDVGGSRRVPARAVNRAVASAPRKAGSAAA